MRPISEVDAARTYDLFLSYGTPEQAAAFDLQERLEQRGYRVFLEGRSLEPGGDRVKLTAEALDSARVTVVLVSGSGADYYGREEIARAVHRAEREGGSPGAHRVVPVFLSGSPEDSSAVPFGLLSKQPIDALASGGLAGVVDELTHLMNHLGRRTLQPPPTLFAGNPFRLLRPFQEDDAELFHGRELFTLRLMDLIRRQRLVLLHGPSGTGKSSLIQAGLLPLLRRDMLALVVQPGADVHAALRAKVQAAAQQWGLSLEVSGDAAPSHAWLGSLISAAGKARSEKGAPLSGLLLVLDQAEELFSGRSPAEQQAVAASLALELREAIVAGGCPLHVLFSLRSDYHGHLDKLRDAGLVDIYRHSLLLHPLDRSATQAAIERPLATVGLHMEAGLLERILTDLSTQTGDISPVELELVCHELYEAAKLTQRAEIREELYRQMGGAGKVLATYVGGVLRGFPGQRPIVLRLLAQLLGSDGRRQPAKGLDELCRQAELGAETARRFLEDLVKQRVLTSTHGEQGEERLFRIGHDLIAVEIWNQLSEVQQLDRELSERLHQLSMEWAATGRSFWLGYVSPGTRSDLLDWHARHPGSPADIERAFLRSISRFHRADRVARYVLPVIGLLLLAGSGFLVHHYRETAREQEAQAAEAHADHMLERNPGRALAWIKQAAELRGGFESESEERFDSQWLAAREAWDRGFGWIVAEQQQVPKLAFSPPSRYGESCQDCWPNRRLLAWAASDGNVWLLDLSQGGSGQPLPDGHKSVVQDVAFSPDGRFLASCGWDNAVRIWDVASRRLIKVLSAALAGTEFTLLAFSPDGRWLAVANHNGLPTLGWQLQDLAAPPRELSHHSATLMALSFSPDSRWLAEGDAAGELTLTDLITGTEIRRDGVSLGLDAIQSLVWSPRQNRLALNGSAGSVNNVVLLSPQGNELSRPAPLAESPVVTIAFSPDGQSLGLGNLEGTVWRWDLRSGAIRILNHHHGAVFHTEWSRDGHWLLSSGADGLLQVTHFRGLWQRRFQGHDGEVRTAAFSPDNMLVASAGTDGRVRVWPLQPGRTELRQADSMVRYLTAADPRRVLIAGTEFGRLLIWSSPQINPSSVTASNTRLSGVCFGKEDQVLVASRDGVSALHIPDGALIDESKSPEALYSIYCPPTGPFFTGHEHAIYRWTGLKEAPQKLGEHDRPVSGFALLSHQRLISASMDKTLRVWDLGSGTVLQKLTVSQGVSSLAPLSEHEMVFAGNPGDLQLWDVARDKVADLGPAHGGVIYDIAVSPRQTLVAVARSDGLLLLWPRSQVSQMLRGHVAAVTSVAFATDTEYLVSGGNDTTIRVWPLPPTDRAGFALWLKQVTPWNLHGGQMAPKPLPAWSEAFVGPPAPLHYDPGCLERDCKDLTQYKDPMTLDMCVSACLVVD